MHTAMKGVTKALVAMNNKMNLPGLQKIMAEFLQENERSEFVQEALGDALDDAMAEEGSTEQEEAIVNQVFDELGVSLVQTVPEAPIGTQQKEVEGTVFKVPALAAVIGGAGAGGGSGGATAGSNTDAGAASAPSAGASGSADPELASLEARLNNLRSGNP
jgi:Snf7